MQQAADFLTECEVLHGAMYGQDDGFFVRPTQFKNWSPNDVLVHLHFWNQAADLALNDTEAFKGLFSQLSGSLADGSLRAFENKRIEARGRELLAIWFEFAAAMAGRWKSHDPKIRVPWAGPDMSVRSSITARQMETWAHGQEVFDLLGKVRPETDRIRNIVILGINTFGWSFRVQGLDTPAAMPQVELVSPSGEAWQFEGDPKAGLISGSAVEFCQVVTQTRNIDDTALKVEGETATLWMQHAQCFAGGKETPPAPGARGPSRS